MKFKINDIIVDNQDNQYLVVSIIKYGEIEYALLYSNDQNYFCELNADESSLNVIQPTEPLSAYLQMRFLNKIIETNNIR